MSDYIGMSGFVASFISYTDSHGPWSIGIPDQFVANVAKLPKPLINSFNAHFGKKSQIQFVEIFKRVIILWYLFETKKNVVNPFVIGALWQIKDESELYQSIFLFTKEFVKNNDRDSVNNLSKYIAAAGQNVEYNILIDLNTHLKFSYDKLGYYDDPPLNIAVIQRMDEINFEQSRTNVYFEGEFQYSKLKFWKPSRYAKIFEQ